MAHTVQQHFLKGIPRVDSMLAIVQNNEDKELENKHFWQLPRTSTIRGRAVVWIVLYCTGVANMSRECVLEWWILWPINMEKIVALTFVLIFAPDFDVVLVLIFWQKMHFSFSHISVYFSFDVHPRLVEKAPFTTANCSLHCRAQNHSEAVSLTFPLKFCLLSGLRLRRETKTSENIVIFVWRTTRGIFRWWTININPGTYSFSPIATRKIANWK